MIEGSLCPHGHLLTKENVSVIAGYVRCRKCAVIISRRAKLKKRERTGWRPSKRLPTIERFWKYVTPEPNSGCWLWSAFVDSSGYGAFSVGLDWQATDKKSRIHKAHRVSYEINVGPIPEGLQLDHICRVRSCVNPDHLRPVTAQQNIQYAGPYISAAHRNRKKTECPHGHPYSPENTLILKHGWRRCGVCHRAHVAKQSARKLDARRSKKIAALHAANLHEETATCRFERRAEIFTPFEGENFA